MQSLPRVQYGHLCDMSTYAITPPARNDKNANVTRRPAAQPHVHAHFHTHIHHHTHTSIRTVVMYHRLSSVYSHARASWHRASNRAMLRLPGDALMHTR